LDNGKRVAFTLAEVLIVLAIIGMVAVLTVPTLMQNYQKKVFVSQLQKTMSLLDTGFRLMMANEGVDYIYQTKTWQEGGADRINARPTFQKYFKATYKDDPKLIENYSLEYREYFMSVCQSWETVEKPYDQEYINRFPWQAGNTYQTEECMKFEDESQGYRWMTTGSLPGLISGTVPTILNNGVYVWIAGKEHGEIVAITYIDVNGKNKPNQAGYDIQKLGIRPDGHVVPMNINGNDEYDTVGGTIGAKRIKDDGWKITY